MIVMPSNCTGQVIRGLDARHPGQLGHLFGPEPGGWRTPFMSYTLDNGAFGAWTSDTPWDEARWLALLARAHRHQSRGGEPPRWLLVPDRVAARDETLRLWEVWAPRLTSLYGWPLAFAVQDGMTAADVPPDAAVVFIGGTTRWKRRNLGYFAARFPRVHVGRINTRRWLWVCAEYGVESCDGTGWLRGDQDQLAGLYRFLGEWQDGQRARHPVERYGPLFHQEITP